MVKKWQQVDGRGALAPGQALHPGTSDPKCFSGRVPSQGQVGRRKAQGETSDSASMLVRRLRDCEGKWFLFGLQTQVCIVNVYEESGSEQ